MKISVRLFAVAVFLFPVVCNAQGGEKYIGEMIVLSHHKTTDTKTKPPDYYRDIAFDDYGRRYGLKENKIDIYDSRGEVIRIVSFTNPTLEKKGGRLVPRAFPSGLEVSSDGTIFYVTAGTDFVISINGHIVAKPEWPPGHIKLRRPDGVIVDSGNKTYDKDLTRIEWSAPSWLVDSKGNYFEFYGGPIIKFSKDGETVWDKDFDRYSVIGIDAEDNIYLLRGTFSIDKDVRKVDPEGNIIVTIDLMPKEMFFTKESFKNINPFPDLPFTPEIPNVRVFVTSDGSIYQWFDFSRLSKKRTKAWLASGDIGGKYIVYKYGKLSINAQKERVDSALRVIREMFKRKKYEGDSREYDLNELVESAGFRLGGQKLYIRTLRNEIFARHGRAFKSKDLKAIFESSKWYKPDPNYSDDMLNNIERKNIRFILDYEKMMGWKK